jgi:predicted Zn-dependent protease
MRSRARYDSAQRYLDLALAQKPHYLQALLVAGELALQRNDVPAALTFFGTAERTHPSSVDARVGLGWATLISGQVEEAGRIWRPVTSSTADPVTLRRMMEVYERLGDAPGRIQAAARLESLRTGNGASP